MDILFTAGNFDDNGGRPSGLAAKMIEVIKNMEENALTFMNGGTYDELVDAAYAGDKYDVIFWFANVPNDKSKIDVKGYAPRALLVSSKRNNDEYEFHELVMRSLKSGQALHLSSIRTIPKMGSLELWYSMYWGTSGTKDMITRLH